MFSVALAVFCAISIGLALEEDNKNRRYTYSKFGDKECTSSIKAIK